MELYVGHKLLLEVPRSSDYQKVSSILQIPQDDFYLLKNGKRISQNEVNIFGKVDVVYRLVGGKGGFGSMLRAIGAQIEKTTNREACRDLSGRRLRDINEEQRLKNWIAAQADREKEAAEKKQKKLERLIEQPKHEFKDEEYDKIRSALPEKVEDAVLQGLQASCSTKRKSDEGKGSVKKKKPKLWIDDELSESDGDVDSEDESKANFKSSKEIVAAT
ncbi:splicing regulator SDE2 [Tribolium castaneum]|uniref:Protein SDE2 homolog-like Protein n=1 Tax=Tribolium castaneum TaxID=7070 RepID=A0A139WFI2_TRICA|nr:PREDICTED: protein SDE2 homolog [Tribolium castaneum]KYB26758.1 Protein SDE2 homolog-like Protein [Tribolium castaneum]|eukprot:XP_008193796.1 PREDICTED: protein SDE2 homolog [Tribolium castaneum]